MDMRRDILVFHCDGLSFLLGCDGITSVASPSGAGKIFPASKSFSVVA